VRIKNDEAFFLLLVAQASIALGSAIHRGLASIDKLTQLYNRTFLQKRMKEEVEFCNRQLLPLSLMMLDIDHFKAINDTYGHQEGDMVLKKIAQIISKCVRLTDICARYGGEEFVIVLPGIEEIANDKFSIAEKVRQGVEHSDFVVLGDKHIKVTISVGVMVRRYPEDKDFDMNELIKRADEMLYKAKKEGRNRVCYS
jgi:diguanylate cyclase (GGDEF)-like protein